MNAAQKRIADNVRPVPPTWERVVRVCQCTASYLDYDMGRDAHEVVFGHQPIPGEDR